MAVTFPEIQDLKIDTLLFLQASDDFIDVIEKFGRLFTPVSSDMRANVEKIYSVYNKNPSENKYIQEMLLKERDRKEDLASISLLWLRRALHFTLRLFEYMQEDVETGRESEDVSEYLKLAYKEVLEPYHNWAARKLFQLFYCTCPSRSYALNILFDGKADELAVRGLPEFTSSLRKCVENLIEFYKGSNFDNSLKG